jgi:hypothetical protein
MCVSQLSPLLHLLRFDDQVNPPRPSTSFSGNGGRAASSFMLSMGLLALAGAAPRDGRSGTALYLAAIAFRQYYPDGRHLLRAFLPAATCERAEAALFDSQPPSKWAAVLRLSAVVFSLSALHSWTSSSVTSLDANNKPATAEPSASVDPAIAWQESQKAKHRQYVEARAHEEEQRRRSFGHRRRSGAKDGENDKRPPPAALDALPNLFGGGVGLDDAAANAGAGLDALMRRAVNDAGADAGPLRRLQW